MFDGAGGLRLGLEAAGMTTSWALEYLNGQDVTTVEPRGLAPVDIISGGPPCQRGSFAAAISGTRTKVTLWPEMLRFAEALRPSWMVVENVPGFRVEMLDWTRQLQRLGYGCAGRAIDSKHWVPQQRARYFIVGRLGITGLALWDYLYAAGRGVAQRPEWTSQGFVGGPNYRPCAECVRGGVSARVPSQAFALLGAGNAVTVGLATWLGSLILGAEREIAA